VFDYEDRTVVKESHGFDDGFYETFSCCPNCGGDFEDAIECHECGEAFTEDEIYGDKWCENCLRKTINYDTFFEYCEANKDEQYLDTFVMCELLNCEYVPKYSSYEFHDLMVQVYNERVEQIKRDKAMFGKTYAEIIDACVRFIMDDDGSIGRENYADWLNSKKEVK
jgi:hypothetical protein